MMFNSRFLLSFALVVLLVFGSSASLAQTTQGQITGTVTDSTGAVVPGATVAAVNEETGAAYSTVSTGSGSYRFPSVVVGPYKITISASGFRDVSSKGIVVQVGSVATLNVKLALGATTDTVQVDASAAGVETQTSDVGGVITGKQIEELPLALGGLGQLRAIESFVFLIPGTVGPGTATAGQGGNSAQTAGIYLSKIGGGQNFGAQVLLDGLSTQREENGSTFDETSPSVEAISEFKVTTSTPAAEFGRTSGGIENFLTKGGGNDYHGTVFDIYRNTALDANDYFSSGNQASCALTQPNSVAACRASYARAKDMKNDYGVTLGGPVRIPHVYNGKDKTFFFFAFEQFRKGQATAATSSVPTALERTGDFSELLGSSTGEINPCTGMANLNGEVFDPATNKTVIAPNGATVQCRSPFLFGGKLNVMDPARITAFGKALINAYPLPQTAGLSGNYVYRSNQSFQNTVGTLRVDQNLGQKLKFYADYSQRENSVPFGGSAPNFPGPAGANLIQDFTTHYTRVGVNYTISPNLLNTFLFGINRIKNTDISSEIAGGVNYAAQLGVSGINSTAFPFIAPQSGITPLGASLNSNHTETHFLLNDSVDWAKGRNNFKFGFETRYTQFVAKGAGDANSQIYGYIFETAAARAGSGFEGGTGFGLAGLYLGQPDFLRLITPQDPKWITDYYAGYIQDDLKLTQSLVLNLGVRYDVDTPRREARNMTSNFSPTATDPLNGRPGALVFGTNCKCNTRWANTYFKDIAPRVGFAFTPPNSGAKTVLRGGFAMLYAPLLYADFGGDMQQGYSSTYASPGDGFNPVPVPGTADTQFVNLNNGFPAYPQPPDLDPGQMDTGNAAGPSEVEDIQPNFGRNGMISEWNLQVQQELAKNTIFTLGYIGQAGQNLPSFLLQPNNFATKNLALGDKLSSFDLAGNGVASPYPGFNGSVGQALRPFPQYGNLRTPSDIENAGHTSFHAMVVQLSHHTGYGLTADASYTWSKTITNADSAIGGINGGVAALIQDTQNLRTAKSISTQDVPHNFVVNYLYELPVGRGKHFGGNMNGIVNSLIGGWTVGGIQRYLSGVPIAFGCASGLGTPGYNNCFTFTQLPNTKLSSGLGRHQVKPFNYILGQAGVGGVVPSHVRADPSTDSIFNGLERTDDTFYSALQPNPALYDQNQDVASNRNGGAFTFGNLPRVTGAVRNFPYLQEDFVLIKNTSLFRERYRFQFRAEALNAFNRHNFNAPDANPYASDFGVPLSVAGGSTDSQRRLQLTARINF